MEGKIRHYDTQTGKKGKTFGRRRWGLFPDKIRSLSYLSAQGQVAVASDKSNIRLFTKSVKKSHQTLDWHQGGLFSNLGQKTLSLASSKNGLLVAGGLDGTLAIYEKTSFELKARKELGKGGLVALDFSKDGQFLAVADDFGSVLILKSPDFEVVQKIDNGASPLAVSFSHDTRLIATGGADCQVRLFYLNSGKELLKLSHHSGAVLDLDFSETGSKLVSIGKDKRLYLTELRW